jgi:hypothetical protein
VNDISSAYFAPSAVCFIISITTILNSHVLVGNFPDVEKGRIEVAWRTEDIIALDIDSTLVQVVIYFNIAMTEGKVAKKSTIKVN